MYYIYLILYELHKEFPDKSFSLDDLRIAFYTRYPEAKEETYGNLFTALQSVSLDKEVGSYLLAQIKRRKRLLGLSEQAFKVANGSADENTLKDYLEDVPDTELLDSDFVTGDLDSLLSSVVDSNGLRWRLDCLNKSLGSLRNGDFGFVFARPETGKTTFLASEISHMIPQAIKPIIWFNNEEQGEKVMIRLYQATFGVDLPTLMANRTKFKTQFLKLTDGKFFLVDDAQMSWDKAEKIIRQVDPALVVYDQIDKIKGISNDREDLRLGAGYQRGRELAKLGHASIGVCQSDASGEGVRWLHMDNVANAKTSKQAEADFILGIGAIHDTAQQYVRFLNISKNKLMGDKDTIPALKHGQFETIIEPTIARYRDVITYA